MSSLVRAALLLFLCALSACESKLQSVSSSPTPKPSKKVEESAARKPVSLEDARRIAKQFAQEYDVKDREKSFTMFLNLPDSITTAFRVLRADTTLQEKYLTLLFIKLYHAHVLCCHQSYELYSSGLSGNEKVDSTKDRLFYEFSRIMRYYDPDHMRNREFITSSIAYGWVKDNPRLLEDADIRREWKAIEREWEAFEAANPLE